MPDSSSVTLIAASLIVACGLNACGETTADRPSRSYLLDVTDVSFPDRQRLPTEVEFTLTLHNPGAQPVPAVAITLTPADEPGGSAFQTRAGGPDAAAMQRPVWIVNSSPGAGPNANRSSWTIGTINARATRTLRWKLIPVRAGSWRMRWIISGVDSSTLVKNADGSPLTGVLTTTIDRRAKPITIDRSDNIVNYGDR